MNYVRLSDRCCPRCDGALVRTPRRPGDRLLSFFAPLQRYRCTRFLCQWVGNIRLD